MEASSSLYNVASNVYLTCELRLKCESGFAYHKTFVYEPTPGGQAWSIVQRCCTLVTFCRFCWCLAITFCECVPALWDVKHVMSLLKCFSYINPTNIYMLISSCVISLCKSFLLDRLGEREKTTVMFSPSLAKDESCNSISTTF